MRSWLLRHQNFLYPTGSGILVFLLYLPTVVPDLTWFASSGDGGELITAAVTLGIPHPPGYPTYILLGKLFSFLPVDPIAYRFHLFSALCTAIAAAFVTATTQLFAPQPINKRQRFLNSVPAFLFAFSPLVWQQSVVAEVYSLNLAVVAAFLWTLLGKRPSSLTGLLFGLSLTTHLTSVLLLPLAIACTPWRKMGQFAVGTLLGLSPYLLLPALARQGSPVIWGDPSTVQGWWWLVTAQIYYPHQFALPLGDLWPRLTAWGGTFSGQLAIAGWPLLILSGWTLKNGRLPQNRWWLLLGTAAAYVAYAILYNTPDSIVLTLPAWLIVSLCLIPALKPLKNWGLLLPGMALLLHLFSYNGANIHNIRLPAEQVLSLAPPNAVLITSGDPDIFTLWYFHYVEKQRPDVILVDSDLFALDWYRFNLTKLYPELRALAENNFALFKIENEPFRPFCRVYFQLDQDVTAQIDCSEEED